MRPVDAGGIRRETATAIETAASSAPAVAAPAGTYSGTVYRGEAARMEDVVAAGGASAGYAEAATASIVDFTLTSLTDGAKLPNILSVVSRFRSSIQQELFLSNYTPEFVQAAGEIENPPQFTIGRRYLRTDDKLEEQYESVEKEELRFSTETPSPDSSIQVVEFFYSEEEDEALDYESPSGLQVIIEDLNIPTVSTYVNSIRARNLMTEDINTLEQSVEEGFSVTGQSVGIATDVPSSTSTPTYTDTGGSIGLGRRQSSDVATAGAAPEEATKIISGY